MWVNNLNILVVLSQQESKVQQRFLYSFCKIPDRSRLSRGNPSVDTFSRKQNLIGQIVTAHTFWISNRVDFSQNLDQFRSLLRILNSIDDDATTSFLTLLYLQQVPISFYRLRYVQPCICLYQHELKHVDLFVGNPGLVKYLETARHFLHNKYDCQLIRIFDYTFVKLSNHVLNNSELVEKFSASIKYLMRKDIFLTVDPQIWESLLCRVQYLC